MQLQMPHTLEVLENDYAICVCIHFNIIAAGFFSSSVLNRLRFPFPFL